MTDSLIALRVRTLLSKLLSGQILAKSAEFRRGKIKKLLSGQICYFVK